jgi:hypothetical protein
MRRLAISTVLLALAGVVAVSAQTEVEDRVRAETQKAIADASSAVGAVAGAPVVSERYQATINRGWEEASAGETPAYACAGLKGRILGRGAEDPEVLEALFACNVLLPVRYFETLLDRIGSGEKSCADLMMAMATQLSAMTLAIDTIEGMLNAFERSGAR